MLRSGMSVQLRGFTTQIESGIKQNPAHLDERMVNALVAGGREAFRPDVLEQEIAARVAKKLTVSDER